MSDFMTNLRGFALLFIVFQLSACGGSSETSEPPNEPPPVSQLRVILSGNQTVEFLKTDGDAQLAGSTTGLYWRESSTASWQLRTPSATAITGIAIIGAGHYIVAAQPSEQADQPFPLYESTDSGQTWQAITHNFGGEFNTPIFNLAYDARTDQIYALGQGALAVANRSAANWTLLHGAWDTFATGMRLLVIDPIKTTVWFGGQGAIENGYFGRYNQTTGSIQEWNDLLAPPSTFKGGLIHPLDNNTVMFSGENGIVRSTDYGETWTTPLGDVEHAFFWDVKADTNGDLYTARYTKLQPEQPLIVLCSENNGESWQSHDFSSETDIGGVKSLMLAQHDDEELLYLGLWQGGIKALPLSALSCAN